MYCSTCKKEVDEALFELLAGDRLMEGVKYLASMTLAGKWIVTLPVDTSEYFERAGLSEKVWLKRAAENLDDIIADECLGLVCATCGDRGDTVFETFEDFQRVEEEFPTMKG